MSAVEIITPKDHDHWLQLRCQDVTSTESAALFGMSPYLTHFELWHAKHSGDATPFKSNDRMTWGTRLEAAIAHGIAEDRGWKIEPMKDYWRLPDLRMGSSFDFVITNLPDGPAHLEIKNVDYLAFRDGWIEHDDESIEAPEHIEMQVQHQMGVSSFKRSFIGALIGGNRTIVIERERDEDVIAAIKARVENFWISIADGIEPAPVMPDDAAAVIRLNRYAEPGKVIDGSGDEIIESLVRQYNQASTAEKLAKEDKDVAKARLFEHIGDAEKVLLPGWTISAGMVADTPGTEVTADMVGTFINARKGFRNLRISAKKAKA